jgi:hypothetical protein
MHGVMAAQTSPTPDSDAVASRKSVYADVAGQRADGDVSTPHSCAYAACSRSSSRTPAIRSAKGVAPPCRCCEPRRQGPYARAKHSRKRRVLRER